jgi:molybdopterin-containing oxidoreductase family iron-sulfur binding subunit
MDSNNKIYWKGLEQLTNDSEFIKNAAKEFPEDLPIKDAYGDNSQSEGTSRRDFLKMMGFSIAAVSLAACEPPVKKAIPYLNKPESVEPGIANYYASAYYDGGEFASVVVKTREGRPILVEGNSMCPLTKGGVNARVSASILDLYDSEKLKGPKSGTSDAKWADIDKAIIAGLQSASNVRIVSNTILSPSTKKLIADFTGKYQSTKLVTYDAISHYGIQKAHQLSHKKAFVPSYDFTKADVVVSVGADFLTNWVFGIANTKQYASRRKVSRENPNMSRHYQFEANFTTSGASADFRTPIKPSQEGAVVLALYNAIASEAGQEKLSGPEANVDFVKAAAKDLLAAKGKSLVIAGANDVYVQYLVNKINEMLENYGQTVNIDKPYFMWQGNDEAMSAFIEELKSGSVDAVIFLNCNPVYDHPKGAEIAGAIGKAKLSVSTSGRFDETASKCKYTAPDRSFLESWNDVEPMKGAFALCQPVIRNVNDSRQSQDSLMQWAEMEGDYLTFIKKYWRENIFSLQDGEKEFEMFWNKTLHDGLFATDKDYTSIHRASESEASIDQAALEAALAKSWKADGGKEWELVVYAPAILGSGSMANNPWLQEVPDPISKVSWTQCLALPQAQAQEMGFVMYEGKVNFANVKVGGQSMTLPVVVQPGLKAGVATIALGYGRGEENCGKVAAEAGGQNAYPLLVTKDGGALSFFQTSGVTIEKTDETAQIPQTQTAQTILGRQTIIQEASLALYKDEKKFKESLYDPRIAKGHEKVDPTTITIWDVSTDGYDKKPKKVGEEEQHLFTNRHSNGADKHKYPINHWGMVIDLNSCTGCSACVIACHIENNVPVVGRVEVARRREMHWMRIDRYYSSPSEVSSYDELQKAAENPEVVFQPMMCQHCNNAPCETVCPFAATTHSTDGLNQMTYNRCVGTKYCANNCPYKVRRFNWFNYANNSNFDYYMNDSLGKMVLNPDVTVRSRGVMEKCSMCVQRIQLGKLTAKKESRAIRDGEVVTACASACPADAITFGDLNDTESKISKLLAKESGDRAYNVLKEINVSPNVWYLTKVRNREAAPSTKDKA